MWYLILKAPRFFRFMSILFHKLVFLLSVTIAVTVAIAFAVAVLAVTAVLAVAVVIAGAAAVHVYAVDKDAYMMELAFADKFVDKLEIALGGEAGTADIDCKVGYTGDNLGISNHSDRGAVDYYIVEVLLQYIDGIVQGMTGHKLCRVRWYYSARKDVEIVAYVALLAQ